MSLPLIDRYIATSVFAAIAAVLLCALSLTGVFALIDEAGGIDQNYTFTDAALYVLYNLRRIHRFLDWSWNLVNAF